MFKNFNSQKHNIYLIIQSSPDIIKHLQSRFGRAVFQAKISLPQFKNQIIKMSKTQILNNHNQQKKFKMIKHFSIFKQKQRLCEKKMKINLNITK